ncbi:MAG: AraC family transcriptional regulator [Arenicella sp.]
MKQEIIKTKLGETYVGVPTQEAGYPYLHLDNAKDPLAFSDITLPMDVTDEFYLPPSEKHVLGVFLGSDLSGLSYQTGGANWQPIDLPSESFGINTANQSGMGLRWSKYHHSGIFNILMLYLCPDKMQRVAIEVFDTDVSCIDLPSQLGTLDPFISKLVISLRDELRMNSDFCPMYKEAVLNMLCVHVLRRYCTVDVKPVITQGGLKSHLLKNVTDYMEDNFDQLVSLERLAGLCNMSLYHFSRLFKQSTGYAPRQYVLNIRIKRAKKMLQETELLIEQIALMVGYSNPNNFTRVFKQRTGFSPKDYRQYNFTQIG